MIGEVSQKATVRQLLLAMGFTEQQTEMALRILNLFIEKGKDLRYPQTIHMSSRSYVTTIFLPRVEVAKIAGDQKHKGVMSTAEKKMFYRVLNKMIELGMVERTTALVGKRRLRGYILSVEFARRTKNAYSVWWKFLKSLSGGEESE